MVCMRQCRHVRTFLVFVWFEGYMDVIALAQHGINYALATLGTSTSSDHIRQLTRLTNEIIFCFDGDRAGSEAAWRALSVCLPLMSGAFSVKFLFLPDGEDPDSIVSAQGKDGFIECLASSLHLSEFLFSKLSEGLDLEFPDGKALFLDRILPHLSSLPEGSYKILLFERVSEIIKVDIDKLYKRLSDSSQKDSVVSSDDLFLSSYIDKAISYLLFAPQLANEVEQINCAINNEWSEVLVNLIKLFQQKHLAGDSLYNISLGEILNNFSSAKVKKRLAQLALIDHPLCDAELRLEFIDLINKFRCENQLHSIDQLILKSQSSELTKDEKDLLKILLDKHKFKLSGT